MKINIESCSAWMTGEQYFACSGSDKGIDLPERHYHGCENSTEAVACYMDSLIKDGYAISDNYYQKRLEREDKRNGI